MFARLIRLALLAEFVLWVALGAWAQGRFGWSFAASLGAVVLGALFLRLAIVGVSLSLSFISRSPRVKEHRLDLTGIGDLVLAEWRAMLANNFLWLPFDRVVLPADPPLQHDARVPVILVHGYFSNRGTLSGLARAIRASGVAPVFVPDLPAVVAPIESFADHLDRVVNDVTQGTGQPKVILVCHSMGGLVARAYLAARGADRVARLVTLGSPHQGTALARLALGANAAQMRRSSAFLRELEVREGTAGPGIPALSVYSVHDNLVAPQNSSRLPWARHAEIHGVAHLAMLLDPRVHRIVLDEIAAAKPPGAP